MAEPDDRPTKTPTTSKEEAETEGQWMARNWLGIAVVSILSLLLIVIGAMQLTGVMDVFAPVAETETQQWAVFFALAVAVIVLAGWSWTAIAGSEK